jgi:hypothetical protein
MFSFKGVLEELLWIWGVCFHDFEFEKATQGVDFLAIAINNSFHSVLKL